VLLASRKSCAVSIGLSDAMPHFLQNFSRYRSSLGYGMIITLVRNMTRLSNGSGVMSDAQRCLPLQIFARFLSSSRIRAILVFFMASFLTYKRQSSSAGSVSLNFFLQMAHTIAPARIVRRLTRIILSGVHLQTAFLSRVSSPFPASGFWYAPIAAVRTFNCSMYFVNVAGSRPGVITPMVGWSFVTSPSSFAAVVNFPLWYLPPLLVSSIFWAWL